MSSDAPLLNAMVEKGRKIRKATEIAAGMAPKPKRASVIKLSPQEKRVMFCLTVWRKEHKKPAPVERLYMHAREVSNRKLPPHRVMQQHVGVIVARLNKKQRRFAILPGGKKHPRTYELTRRA